MSTSAANGPPAMAEPASDRVGVPSAKVLAEPVLERGDGGGGCARGEHDGHSGVKFIKSSSAPRDSTRR